MHGDAKSTGGEDVEVGLGQFPVSGRRKTIEVLGNAKRRNLIFFHWRETYRERDVVALPVFCVRVVSCEL